MDSPFSALPGDKAALRRREQRTLLDKLVEEVRTQDAQIVLLAGDLFDSGVCYWETRETLEKALRAVKAHVFIAPGNHDYYTSRSPYAFMELPENVHIFKAPILRSVELPELNCRVWGAGFTSAVCDALLRRFQAERSGNEVNIAVMHGDLTGGRYNPVTEEQIAASGLDYLALGHVHSFSGIQKAGNTFYAYPGCLEGRGFDETGEKGVIAGTVSRGAADLRFVPIPGRQYRTVSVDLTEAEDAVEAVLDAIGAGEPENIVELTLKGQWDGPVDTGRLLSAAGDRFFHLTVRDETVPRRGLWDGAGEDSLKGLFLARMRSRFEEASGDEERRRCLDAVRYGLAALEHREEWRP